MLDSNELQDSFLLLTQLARAGGGSWACITLWIIKRLVLGKLQLLCQVRVWRNNVVIWGHFLVIWMSVDLLLSLNKTLVVLSFSTSDGAWKLCRNNTCGAKAKEVASKAMSAITYTSSTSGVTYALANCVSFKRIARSCWFWNIWISNLPAISRLAITLSIIAKKSLVRFSIAIVAELWSTIVHNWAQVGSEELILAWLGISLNNLWVVEGW